MRSGYTFTSFLIENIDAYRQEPTQQQAWFQMLPLMTNSEKERNQKQNEKRRKTDDEKGKKKNKGNLKR